MGFLDRLFGTNEEPRQRAPERRTAELSDEQALERYRYMMRTAPPETLEQAHAEAFSRLTPEQRKKLLAELARTAPESERAAVQATPDDPQAMARVATRAEIRQPGVMERLMGSGAGFGPSLFSSFLAGFVGSMVAQSFFSGLGAFGGAGEPDAQAAGDDRTNADHADTDYADDSDYGGDDGGGFDDGGGSFEV